LNYVGGWKTGLWIRWPDQMGITFMPFNKGTRLEKKKKKRNKERQRKRHFNTLKYRAVCKLPQFPGQTSR
jgi:hypothetical protein